MKIKARVLLVSCAAGALAIGAGGLRAWADDTSMSPTESVPWWVHGAIEVGGRGFLNNPQRNGISNQGGQSLAKFYEYSSIKPGPFLNVGSLQAGSKDGLYEVDLWAKNVGYTDQSYLIDWSKAGQQYLIGGWDQTPHVYSTSAQTIYGGIGTNALVLPPGLSAKMFRDAGCTPGPAGCVSPIAPGNAALVQQDILNNLHQTDIGIRRDTGYVEYRATPTPEWDFRTTYTNIHRTGTQIEGVVFSPGTTGVRVDAAQPVNDTTHNYGASGEYAGTSFWGQKFNFKMAYFGSTFVDDWSSYTVENPFCPAGAVNADCARNGSASAPFARMSLWPNNQANAFSTTLGADLPHDSRYMGTVTYNAMRQNDAFLPFTATPFSTTGGFPPGWVGQRTAAVNSTADLPASSLGGGINTLLINNVLTTKITPDLKTKLSYRYYDYDNRTAELLFPDWVLTDAASAKATTAAYAPVSSLSTSYNKQNAGAQVDWRPWKQVNLGAAYGFERYDWTRADVDVTNEHTVKVFGDYKPFSWGVWRASWEFGSRRFNTYDYLDFVATSQWPTPAAGSNPFVGASTRYATAYRQLLLDNRDRNKAKVLFDIDAIPGVVITPNFGLRNDDYRLNPTLEEGLQRDHAWNAGIDVSYVPTPGVTLLVSYTQEHQNQTIRSGNLLDPTSANSTDVKDTVHTVMAATNWEVVPNRFDVKLSYTTSLVTDTQPLFFDNGTGPSAATGGQYPAVRTQWQRLEAVGKYKFEEDVVRRLGWNGDVIATLRYAWEINQVANWQNDLVAPYLGPAIGSPAAGFCGAGVAGGANGCGYMVWTAWNNPNYNVQLLSGSLAFKW
jgi:hypothetical protein